ncbi:hypothetical protein D3C87_1319130 [compost metagenome]
MEELRSDPIVEADAPSHFLDIGAGRLAKIGHLVDEGDLHGKESIGRIFDELGGAAIGKEDRCLVEIERPVDLGHDLAGPFVINADDDAVGALEVLDRGTLAQEFGVGHDGHVRRGIHRADDMGHLVARPHRHGRFGDDNREALDRLCDLAGDGIDEA